MSAPVPPPPADDPAACPNGCGPLRWVDDQWWCPTCGDEWSPDVIPAPADDQGVRADSESWTHGFPDPDRDATREALDQRDAARIRATVLSGLLRGMARRVGNLRKNGRHFVGITEKLQDRLDSACIERDDLQAELADLDRLRRNHDAMADAYVATREKFDKLEGWYRDSIANRDSSINRLLGQEVAVRRAAAGWQEMLDRGETTAASPGDAVLCGVVARLGAVLAGPAEAPTPELVDDHVAAWIKAARDRQNPDGTPWDLGRWNVLDDLLDDYRLHRATGTPLGQHACEGSYCCADERAPSAAYFGPAEAAEQAPAPGYQRIAEAIENACIAADLWVTTNHAGRELDHDPGVRWLATVLDKAGLIDWNAFQNSPLPKETQQ